MNLLEAKAKIDKLLETLDGEQEMLVEYDGTVVGVTGIDHEVVDEDDEYPKDWNMPAGSEHIKIGTFY